MFPLLLLLLFTLVTAAPQNELIKSLPNLVEPMRSNQYSGYLNISTTKALYYWYVESENDPAKDPVVLWLNGGPGCSSLEGLFVEMGPYRTNDFGETVHRNPWTWNRYASIIYMDAPAGVGFSIRTDNSSKWVYTDDEVAEDNQKGIALWFQKFPERQGNKFYVMGESYGGTYVPMLAKRLAADSKTFPNFVGVAVGNGCIDDVLNTNTVVGFSYNHGFIDETLYRQSLQSCCAGASLLNGCDYFSMLLNETDPCFDQASYLTEANFYSGLDPYFLYYSCYMNPGDKPQFSAVDHYSTILRQQLRRKYFNKPQKLDALPSCTHYNDSTVYLQREDLRVALMIPDSVPPYESCSDDIANQYDFGPSHYLNQAKNIQYLIAQKKKVMLFNGDTDSVCNAIHNAQFVANLGLKKTSNESIWMDETQLPPTIGMITRYEGLDFLTIRGAGHFVSSSNEKPKESLQMFYNYINDKDYSSPITGDKAINVLTTTAKTGDVPTTTAKTGDIPTTTPKTASFSSYVFSLLVLFIVDI